MEKGIPFTGKLLPLVEELAEQMPGGFFIYRGDESEEFLYVNSTMVELLGYDDLEDFYRATGKSFRGLVHPEDLDMVEASIQEQIDTSDDKYDYVEYRVLRKDGSLRWVDDYGHYVEHPDFGPIYYVFINDKTEQKLAMDEAGREAEVIEGLSRDYESIFLLDVDTGGVFSYRLHSAFSRELTEESRKNGPDEVDWRKLISLYAGLRVREEDREKFLNEVAPDRILKRLETEDTYTVDYRARGEGEETRFMEISITRISGEKLHHHAVLGFRDNTEQVIKIREAAAERLRMETELERQKHASEAKSDFLFNVSHDIRTPMNSIMGFTELALRHMDEPEKLREYLEKVSLSNRHMLSLIDDLLEISQLENGNTRIKDEICGFRKELLSAIGMMRPEILEKEIRLVTEIDISEEQVHMDALRFRRIILNILSNAVKFTPAGGEIHVRSSRSQISGSDYSRYVIEIEDNGAGMNEDFLQRLFEAFEREESSTKTGQTGIGVGLAITKKLLDLMGGSIEVRSRKGEGSLFTVSLPLKTDADGGESEPAGGISAESRVFSGKGKKKRILLVEDIEINRMLAETVLAEYGFEVEAVPDGSDAVKAVEKSPEGYYDLVLMDIQMPFMNGYEATRLIRALGRPDTDRIPIIALSANTRDEDRKMSLESGMNTHVAKPFDAEKLIDIIESHLSDSASLADH